ncbi:MAG TPA: hypothetical protein VIV35_03585 [Chitinophagaceae bacterium]
MKKTTTTLVLSIICLCSFSQVTNPYYTIPIQQDTAIQWAAECDKVINLSPRINEYSLKKWYLDKLKNGSITAYQKNKGSSSVSSYSLSMPGLQTQDWLKGLAVELPAYKNPKEWYFVDNSKPKNDYDRLKYRVGGTEFSADSCCGCDGADAFRVKQILNYKNGKFSIYDVFISPLCARQTANPPFEWYLLCNVAYNDNMGRKFPGLSKDVVLLNTDEVDYNFSRENPTPFDSVLTVYRTDIGSLIYQDILKGQIKPVDILTGKQIPVKKFLTWQMPADTVADINDNGQITKYRVVQQERSSGDLSRLRIKQDLYFDFKNERLYSVIRQVIIMIPIRSYSGNMLGYSPFCRLQ